MTSLFAPGLASLHRQKKNLNDKLNAAVSKGNRYKKKIEKLKTALIEKDAIIADLLQKLENSGKNAADQ